MTGESKRLLGKHRGAAQLLPNILKNWICSRKGNSSVANIKAATQNKANEQPLSLFEMMRFKSCGRTLSYSSDGSALPRGVLRNQWTETLMQTVWFSPFENWFGEKKEGRLRCFILMRQMSGSWVCFQADNFLIFLLFFFFKLLSLRLWTILSLSSQPVWVLSTSHLIKWSIRDNSSSNQSISANATPKSRSSWNSIWHFFPITSHHI